MDRISRLRIVRNRRGQLFLIEVFISVSVLILLMSALVIIAPSSNSRESTSNDELIENAQFILQTLQEAGLLKDYLEEFHNDNSTNLTLQREIAEITEYSVSSIVRFQFNFLRLDSNQEWEVLDALHFDSGAEPAESAEIVSIETFVGGFSTTLASYTVQINLWYEGI